MKRFSFLALVLVVAAWALPGAASAQTVAYAVPGSTNVRAGPGTQFPVVARARGGSEILVLGCLSDRAWCEVEVYDVRGWMSARRLEFVYAGYRRLVPEYYAYFGAPIISFDFDFRNDRRHHRRDRRDNNNLTECLAPEGFCPGDRRRGWDGGYENQPYEDIQPGSQGRGYSGNPQVSSGNAEVIRPADEPLTFRDDGGVVTECLAPDGFCP